MQLKLICVGQKMPNWVVAGYEEYAVRLTGQCRLTLVEVPPAKRTKTGAPVKYMEEEALRIESALVGNPIRVILDEHGAVVDTKAVAKRLETWLPSGRDVALIVGGPDGLAPSIKAKADWTWSLTPLTLPHPLVRVVLAEQLYRAWSLMNHHPYHRE
ncbi:MAG: 23S rRNA (pseudouridine(1915)-N(3))-methyltransferase RlmH [Proteobacteria bacterium]|nr:23S rRNA (pseudouridine(1915)-N(3))-methyltransferase RlmH [Pseudomonadota bacterium]